MAKDTLKEHLSRIATEREEDKRHHMGEEKYREEKRKHIKAFWDSPAGDAERERRARNKAKKLSTPKLDNLTR